MAEKAPVYCTWSYRSLLPPDIRSQFRDLDQFVRSLCSSATEQIVMVAPYLSVMGMKSLRASLATSAQRGAWIRLLTSNLKEARGWNRKAITALVEDDDGALVRSRLRILAPTENLPALIHAKIILTDHRRGYLGSANLSRSAMDLNLEVGLSLAPAQVGALESLISLLEAQNFVVDYTATVLGKVDNAIRMRDKQ